MKLLSLLPLLYSQKLFGTQGLFKNRDFANTGATTHAQNQQELGLQKMQEPHEQRNRQEEKPRKHSSPKPHKSKHFAKANSQLQGLNNSRNHGKEHSESSLYQLTGSVFLSLQSPTPPFPNAKTSGTSFAGTVISKHPTTHSHPSFVV